MTNLSVPDPFLSDLIRAFFGGPAEWELSKGYPLYDLVKVDDETIVLEFALAGFAKEHLEVDVINDILRVTGKKNQSAGSPVQRRISRRSFEKCFILNKELEVVGADHQDGVLTITIRKKTVDVKRKIIEINSGQNITPNDDRQLLQEETSS